MYHAVEIDHTILLLMFVVEKVLLLLVISLTDEPVITCSYMFKTYPVMQTPCSVQLLFNFIAFGGAKDARHTRLTVCVLLVFAKHFIIMVASVSYYLRIYEFDTTRWLQIASRYPDISVRLFIVATRSRSII